MSYQQAMDAINLKMPDKIPRTEYSAPWHWKLVSEVSGIHVTNDSTDEVKTRARKAFERAWDFGFTWTTLTYNQELEACRTSMGHAEYQEGGTDYDNNIFCPFQDAEQVLRFDPYAVYGARDIDSLIKGYNEHYDRQCENHPDQVSLTGIYITLISGLLEIFGWERLLEALGEDPYGFGDVANRYADWIMQYFNALAQSKAEVVMIHDDIVWTSGAFTHPKWYNKYVFGNYERMFEPLHKAGKKILYTSDGTYTQFVADIAAVGVNGFVMEPTTDMAYVAEKFGKTHAFVGNADCRILTYGSKAEIKTEVQRCIDIGKECPGYFFASGNHIPSNVPVENAIYYNRCYEEMAYRK